MLVRVDVDVLTSGLRLPMLVNALLKRDDDGQPQVIRAVMFDASERLGYERELVAARRRPEESETRARVLAETLPAQAVADAVVAAALAFQHGPARDDIAVVVVKVPAPGSG